MHKPPDIKDLVMQHLAERERDIAAMMEVIRGRGAEKLLNQVAYGLVDVFDSSDTERMKDEIVEAMVDGLVKWARGKGWEG